MNEVETFKWVMPEDPPVEGCWEWRHTLCYGYGRIYTTHTGRKRGYGAHIVSHQIFNGPVPDGLHVLHSCDNPVCVQPAHLSVGTQRQNLREMVERKRSTAGEKCSYAKLSDQTVRDIRSSTESSAVWGDRLKVSSSLIRRIRRGENWKHLL